MVSGQCTCACFTLSSIKTYFCNRALLFDSYCQSYWQYCIITSLPQYISGKYPFYLIIFIFLILKTCYTLFLELHQSLGQNVYWKITPIDFSKIQSIQYHCILQPLFYVPITMQPELLAEILPLPCSYTWPYFIIFKGPFSESIYLNLFSIISSLFLALSLITNTSSYIKLIFILLS